MDDSRFKGSEFLTPEVNARIARSEVEGGVWLKDIPVGGIIEIQTGNTLYRLEHREDGFYISGNQRFCPEPTKCTISGSTWGGTMLKMQLIGRGMNLEYKPAGWSTLTSTPISEIREVTE